MNKLVIVGLLLNVFSFCIAQQRVAPGVNPQQYQAPSPQQHHQQQQYQQQAQYQQAPVQHQQQHQQQVHIPQQQVPQQHVPMQQQQVPVQHQQPPPQQQQQPPPQQQQQHQGGHGGHAPHGAHQQHVLHGGNLQEEREHIAGHMEVPIDTTKMTNEELQFHYFKMHDSDNNNKLDGCELIKSLIHWHEQGSKEHGQPGAPHVDEKIFIDDELVSLVDPILNMDDLNRDGFIDYPEFVRAQQKQQHEEQRQQHEEQRQQQQQPAQHQQP